MPNPPPSLLANEERLWTFDLDKSQVRGRYDCVRDIRRSHCQPFCACMLLNWSKHMLASSWSREYWLLKIFCLLCVCFGTRGLTSNNLEAWSRILHSVQEGGPGPSPGRRVLLPDCGNFLDLRMNLDCRISWQRGKRALKTGTAATM
jgi:hypothetical protein